MAKILLIDDDGVVRDALAVFLTRDGHEVITAADGGNGVLAFRQNAPDLVVCDRDLPVMTGSAVLKKIRETSAAVPVIMLTGTAAEDAAKYMASGATAFLSKKDGLLNALEEIDRTLGIKKPPAPPPARPASEPERRPAGAKGVVLVADDDTSMCNAVSRFLASCGYEVLQAGDGDQAVALARAMRPEAAILDLMMPGKDGVDVLRELVTELPGTAFIMFSGNDDDQVARACLKIGARAYVSKPADLEALERLISESVSAGRGR